MSVDARILILGANPLCRNPRVLKTAETLGRNGYDVTAVTANIREDFASLDRRITAEAPFRTIGVEAPGPFARFRDRFRIRLGRECKRRFQWETPWALGPASRLWRIARTVPADLVIVHNELPFWVGSRLASRPGSRVAADFEDWYSKNLDAPARAVRPVRLLEKWERSLVDHAAFCVAPSRAMADAIHSAFGGTPPMVITNSFPLRPVPAASKNVGPPRLVWFSQTIGPGRGLEEFLFAWSKSTRRSRLLLIGEPKATFRENLLGLVAEDRRGEIEFRPFVAPWDLHDLLAEQDIGLALEKGGTPNSDLTISNKILQYLNAGLAVIASHTSGQDEVARIARGAVMQFGNEEELRSVLDGWAGDRDALRAARCAARTAAENRYCWEKEEPKLLQAIERTLG